MLDLKLIRENPKEIEKALQTKDPKASVKQILTLDKSLREKQAEVEALKAKQNTASKQIGEKKRIGEDVSGIFSEMKILSDEITFIDKQITELKEKRDHKLLFLPNLPDKDIPVSLDPKDNVCLKEDKKKKSFDFPFKNHLELNKKLKLFDFERGAKISGRGFVVYTGRGAKLEWALINYMLDIHKENGYTQIMPPLLLRKQMMEGSAHLPKFEDQQFKIHDKDFDLYLLPTSEAALNAMHSEEILENLPIRYTAYTPCFRREAGAAGKQERGLIRTHQFNKVELFTLCKPDQSDQIFEQMVQSAEQVVSGLDLHYKKMLLTTGDMSFAAAKTIDIEVFLPGQNCYYEVSSISNCTDFQARRSQIKYREEKKPQFVHTLNASGVATSRLMVSLLENHQQEDGSIVLPKGLHPYLEKDMVHLKPL